MRLITVFAFLWYLTGSAFAESDASLMAKGAAQSLVDAATQLEAAESANDRVGALSSTIRAYEAGLATLREGLRQAELEERALRLDLQGREDELVTLLVALQKIERDRDVAGLLHPGGPLPALRAGMLTSDLVPEMNARAKALAAELADLGNLIAVRNAGRNQLVEGLDGIRDARLALTQAVSDRSDLPPSVATDDAAMQALLNSAETLSAFADGLTEESPWKTLADETWMLPVRGRIVRGFNEADASGDARPGWVVATEPQALVVAPSSGTIRFTGQIDAYGIVVILEPRLGELLILAGLNETFVVRSQVVEKGHPLGLMGGEIADSQENLIKTAVTSGQSSRETLYIELRQDREAFDPASRFDPDAE